MQASRELSENLAKNLSMISSNVNVVIATATADLAIASTVKSMG